MPKPIGTPGSLGYVNPFAPTKPEPAAAVTDPLKSSFNSIVSGLGTMHEPAVVSSNGATEQIKNAQDKMTQMTDKGTKVDPGTGTATYADGSAVSAPAGSVYNEKTGHYEAADGNKYAVQDFYGDESHAPSPEYTAIEKQFAPLKANLDASTLSKVNAIEQQFKGLKAKQMQFNENASQARSRVLSLQGTTRYAPLDAIGLKLQTASDGLNRITDLDAKENAALADAQTAQLNGEMKLMSDKMSEAEKVRADKQKAADEVMSAVQKANDTLDKQHQDLRKDEAVADQMAKGETDPAKILKALNDAGLTITADEVAKSLKNLTPSTKTSDQYKFTQANTGKLLAAGMTSGDIQKVQDFYNGNGEMPQLDSKQVAAVQQVLSGITPKTAKAPAAKPILDGTLTYTPEDHAADQQALDASRGDDGFTDPTTYQKLYTAWIGQGGTVEGFVKTYPPKNYINPENDWLPTYLRPKAPASGGITAAEIDALFGGKK